MCVCGYECVSRYPPLLYLLTIRILRHLLFFLFPNSSNLRGLIVSADPRSMIRLTKSYPFFCDFDGYRPLGLNFYHLRYLYMSPATQNGFGIRIQQLPPQSLDGFAAHLRTKSSSYSSARIITL